MNPLRWLRRRAPRPAPEAEGPSEDGGTSVREPALAPGPTPGPASAEGDPRARSHERRAAVMRASLLLLTLLALALTARAIVGERGLLDARRSLNELARAQADVEKWRARNAWLEARIKALREDPTTIESMARERLDYVRPGEITFLLPNDPAAPETGEPAPVAPGEFSPVLP